MGRAVVWGLAVALVSPLVAQVSPAQSQVDAGMRYKQAAKYDLAINALNRALALDPSNVDALWVLGWIQAERGQKAEAAASFRRILRAQPRTHRAIEAVAALQRLGESPYYPRPDVTAVQPKDMQVRGHMVIEPAANPMWTVDGTNLVYTRLGSGICAADADGTHPRLVGPGLKLVGVGADPATAFAVPAGAQAKPELITLNLLSGEATPVAAPLTQAPAHVVVAPGGKALASVAEIPTADRTLAPTNVLAVGPADGSKLTELPPTHISCGPLWNSDGTKLLWAGDKKLMICDADGGNVKPLADGEWCAWLGTDKIVGRGAKGELLMIGADGAGATTVMQPWPDLAVTEIWPSPSGKWLLYKEMDRSYAVVNVATKTIVPLGYPERPVICVQWLPKQDLLLTCDRAPYVGHEPLWEVYDPADPWAWHPFLRDTFVYGNVSLSPDGRLAAFWRGSPDSVKLDESSSYRQLNSGRITLLAADDTVRLPWANVATKATSSTAGFTWSPKSDAILYWVPARDYVGVVSLGPKT